MKKLIFLCFLFVSQVSFSQEEKADAGANANNPLANIKAFNIQFNYLTNNTSTDTKTMVTSIRYAQPIGKFLVRATMPFLSTSSPSGGSSMTGTGDFNLFATYLASASDAPVQFGVGPMFYAPTSGVSTNGLAFENANFGANNWQVGAAAIVFVAKSKQFQYGSLVTYVAGIGTDSKTNEGATESLFAFQPFYFFQLGKGAYFRGAPVWTFDFDKKAYNMPIGIGFGQVFKIGNDVVNIFLEPQYSIYSQGFNQPTFQIFTALNFQFY